jgi:hypothetical protein
MKSGMTRGKQPRSWILLRDELDAHTLLITALLVPSRNPIFRFAQSV